VATRDVGGLQSQIRSLSLELDIIKLKTDSALGSFLNFIDNVLGGFGQIRPGEGTLTTAILGDPAEFRRRIEEAKALLKEIFPLEAAQKLGEQRAQILEKDIGGVIDLINRLREGPFEAGVGERAPFLENIDKVEELAQSATLRLKLLSKEVLGALGKEEVAAIAKLGKEATAEEVEFVKKSFGLRKQAILAELIDIETRIGDAAKGATQDIQGTLNEINKRMADQFDRTATSIAEKIASISFEFGPEGLQKAIEGSGLQIDLLLEKLQEMDTPLRRIERLERELEQQAEFIRGTVTDLVGDMRQSLGDFFFEFATGEMRSFADVWTSFWKSLARQASDILSQIAFTGTTGRGGLLGILGGIIPGLSSATGGGTGVNEFIKIIEAAGGFVPLQHGGVVTRPTLALLGEAGDEAVIPLGGKSIGGGVTVINLMRESDLQQVVASEIARNKEVFVNDISVAIRGNRQIRRTIQKLT